MKNEKDTGGFFFRKQTLTTFWTRPSPSSMSAASQIRHSQSKWSSATFSGMVRYLRGCELVTCLNKTDARSLSHTHTHTHTVPFSFHFSSIFAFFSSFFHNTHTHTHTHTKYKRHVKQNQAKNRKWRDKWRRNRFAQTCIQTPSNPAHIWARTWSQPAASDLASL